MAPFVLNQKLEDIFCYNSWKQLAWTLLSNWLFRKVKDWSLDVRLWRKDNKIIWYIGLSPGVVAATSMEQQLAFLVLPFKQVYAINTIVISILRCRNEGKVTGPLQSMWSRLTGILNRSATLDSVWCFENDLNKENSFFFFCKTHSSLLCFIYFTHWSLKILLKPSNSGDLSI